MAASQPPIFVGEDDVHNTELRMNVSSVGGKGATATNASQGKYNLVVIGGGTAGLVTAGGAATLGARVALVEKHLLGGDCLNTGCVPSKCLLRSARAFTDIKKAEQLGLQVTGDVRVDFPAIMARMRSIRAHISHHDSVQRMNDLGVDIYFGEASFADSNTIVVGDTNLAFQKAVIATGGRPAEPEIEGLRDVGYLTSDDVFNLAQCPSRFAVIGGGPIGCELAQAFARFGSKVTLLHNKDRLLVKEDVDVANVILAALVKDSINVVLDCSIARVSRVLDSILIELKSGEQVYVDQILVATGRVPNIAHLGLDKVKVKTSKAGVVVNDHLQTSNSRIYACGDVCMDSKFTHAAEKAARIVIENALFYGRAKLSKVIIPWTTFTEPEVAHVGLGEEEAKKMDIEVDVYIKHFSEIDRAMADGDTNGFVKVLTKKGTDHIVGACIVARHAGDMIPELSVAIVHNIGLGKLAQVVHSYPTYAEAIRQLGDGYNFKWFQSSFVQKVLKWWMSWGR